MHPHAKSKSISRTSQTSIQLAALSNSVTRLSAVLGTLQNRNGVWILLAFSFDVRTSHARMVTHKASRKVDVQKIATGEMFSDEADVVIAARGGLNDYIWPKIDGLWSFKGKIVHSANWDESSEA
jgi:cation diffusion facilitator CzcD-associated flavoprotein CzcO